MSCVVCHARGRVSPMDRRRISFLSGPLRVLQLCEQAREVAQLALGHPACKGQVWHRVPVRLTFTVNGLFWESAGSAYVAASCPPHAACTSGSQTLSTHSTGAHFCSHFRACTTVTHSLQCPFSPRCDSRRADQHRW